jgi:hypothetical protein
MIFVLPNDVRLRRIEEGKSGYVELYHTCGCRYNIALPFYMRTISPAFTLHI